MRLLVRTEREGDLREKTSLGVVDHRVIEAIRHRAVIDDAHHINIADDQSLFVDEARGFDENLPYLGDEGLPCEDSIR